MSDKSFMTVAELRTCSLRDFENGAVQSEIFESLKRMEKLERRIDAVRDNMAQMTDKAQLIGDSTIVKALDLFCTGINAALDETK